MRHPCVCEEGPCVSYEWECVGVSVCFVEVSHVPARHKPAAKARPDVALILALDCLGGLRIDSIGAYG